jgi:acetoin utilization protein AcuB
MLVAAWMSSPVHTVAPVTPAGEAVGLLRRHGVRHLPVTEAGRVVGVVTDRDLRGVEPGVAVGLVMSRPVLNVSPRTRIDRAARLLFDRRIGCLPVLDDGRLVGILTQTDAVAALVAVVRLQVGGHHAEIVVADRPDAMGTAQRVIRSLGSERARLVSATREPAGGDLGPARLRLTIESREPRAVRTALGTAGLTILAERPEEAGPLGTGALAGD